MVLTNEYLLSPWICSFENRLYETYTHSAALYGAAYYRLYIPIYHTVSAIVHSICTLYNYYYIPENQLNWCFVVYVCVDLLSS